MAVLSTDGLDATKATPQQIEDALVYAVLAIASFGAANDLMLSVTADGMSRAIYQANRNFAENVLSKIRADLGA